MIYPILSPSFFLMSFALVMPILNSAITGNELRTGHEMWLFGLPPETKQNIAIILYLCNVFNLTIYLLCKLFTPAIDTKKIRYIKKVPYIPLQHLHRTHKTYYLISLVIGTLNVLITMLWCKWL